MVPEPSGKPTIVIYKPGRAGLSQSENAQRLARDHNRPFVSMLVERRGEEWVVYRFARGAWGFPVTSFPRKPTPAALGRLATTLTGHSAPVVGVNVDEAPRGAGERHTGAHGGSQMSATCESKQIAKALDMAGRRSNGSIDHERAALVAAAWAHANERGLSGTRMWVRTTRPSRFVPGPSRRAWDAGERVHLDVLSKTELLELAEPASRSAGAKKRRAGGKYTAKQLADADARNRNTQRAYHAKDLAAAKESLAAADTIDRLANEAEALGERDKADTIRYGANAIRKHAQARLESLTQTGRGIVLHAQTPRKRRR